MGTITARKRSDKTMGYTTQIRLKSVGRIIYTESRIFDPRTNHHDLAQEAQG